MEGETAAHAGFHSANAAMTHNEDQMAEATIGALANMATATAADRCVVAALTQANSRLIKQLEDTTSELRELKALFHQECVTNGSQEVSTHLQVITVGLTVTRLARLTQA
jgi:phage shock protein A